MNGTKYFCTALAVCLCQVMGPSSRADDTVKDGSDLPALQIKTSEPALSDVSQASNQVLPDVVGPPIPSSEGWTSPPLISQSSYFGNGNGNGNRFWGGADTLLWGIKPGNTPPLATSGTLASLGALGPGTNVLYGGNQGSDLRVGGRFTMGAWLDAGQTRGIEGSFFFLNGQSNEFNANSAGDPGSSVLARPYLNAISGLEESELVSFPGLTSGSLLITSSSQFLGAQLNGICNLFSSNCCSDNCCPTNCCQTVGYLPGSGSQTGYRADMIAGLMYLNLNENLVITENIRFLPTVLPPFDPNSTIQVTDRFETRNNFYGGQVGVRGEWYSGGWFTNATGAIALGDTHQQVRIDGSTVFTSSGGTSVTQPGGLLALPTNMGTYSRDKFTVVPQVGLNVGRQLTSNLRVYVGYTLIYWSSVVRPGDQVDPVINTTQLPTPTGPGVLVGPARPAFAFHDTDFWAQGVNIGMEFRR